jgi:hypothetical protein
MLSFFKATSAVNNETIKLTYASDDFKRSINGMPKHITKEVC